MLTKPSDHRPMRNLDRLLNLIEDGRYFDSTIPLDDEETEQSTWGFVGAADVTDFDRFSITVGCVIG